MKFIVNGLLLNFLLNINAKTVVQIRLIAFRNDGNKAYDGSCCDVFCSTQCDIWFEFCFKKKPSSTCFYGAKTYVLFNDDYSFHSDIKIGKILRNPFQFTYEGIFNGVWFSSSVWDDDHGNHGDYGEQDELVDKYTKCQLLITPSLNESSAHPHPFTITGKHSILRLNIEAHCYPNWYGTDCNTYCVDTNNQNGHYKCDQQTGKKLCLPKWEGAQCNQAICNETCDLQHATCTIPGDCSCDPGWQNDPKTPKLCNTCIKKTNCLNGYCVNGNDCHCQQDWLGELCNQDNNTCRSFPCQNGATCINNGTDVYYCICPPGYTGFNCSTDIDLCESLPCKHGARCINQRVDYICPCPPGYTDKNCETNIDDCLPTPCLNGATCEDGVDSYNCTCVDGFTGDTCNKNIDDCENIQCQNGGICFDHVANFSCQCSQGFIGRLCETNNDDCAAKPCLNKGNCTDLVNNFKCDCVKGFNGRNCGNNIDECPPGTCGLGNCTDLIGDYNCTCPLGYTGRNCETNINDCLPNICNNGTCQDGINSYVCTCKAGFNGTNCETNIDDCHSNPCRNNGACVDMINSYKCHCLAGWSGKNCEDNIDDCVIRCENDKSLFCTPCKNGASCDDQVNNFTCNCSQGYQGRYCEQKINYCAQNDCQNSATCISQLDGFICKCAPGFKGRNCSENIDECELNKCNGTGTQNCVDKIASFGCLCKDGFKGVLCSEDIDECHPRYIGNSPDGHDVTSFGLCGRNGTCVDGVNSRSCTCDEGFTGKYCQTNIDECDPDPCMNGTCYQNLDSAGYICVCDEGYNGTNCDNDIDECATNKNECCENSTCIDGINSYTCQCGPGMKGIDCCSTTSWCENNNTCSRNGQCVDVWNEFRCNCSSTGFTGSRCQQDVDECEVNKICNNGSCDNTRGNYTCWCPDGMTGRHCESGIDDCEKDKVVCKNGFHCIDDHLDFHCNCSSPGFKGKYCDDVDECKQENTCGERKTCVNTIGSYKCPCDIGRAGNNCEKVVDDCDNSTCMANHSKNCYLTEQGYDCVCLGRWTGPSCTVLNMSIPDPCGCKNGACVFREGRVQYCECFNGTEADHCSGEVSERRSILDNLLSLRIGIGLAAGFVFVLIVIVVVIAWRRHYGKAMLFDDGMDKPTKAMTSRPTLNSVGRLDSRLNPIEKQNRTKNMISNPLHSLSRNNPGMKFELDKIESFEFEEY